MPRGEPIAPCGLCGRELPLTFHHLIPRSQHRRTWCKKRYTKAERDQGVDLCRDCHGAVHRFESESSLARNFCTVPALLDHPEIGKFVRWVATQHGRQPVRPPRSR